MEWKETVFDNVARLNRGFDLPNQKIEEGAYPVVASTSIKAFHKEYKIEGPGVVTGRSGSLGTVQYITGRFWPLNTSLYVKDFKGNDEKFIAYFLETMRLENFNSGAGVPTLNQNHLHKLSVKIPPLPIQRKIAAILTAYDDLIETNKRHIVLLEKMTEEFYREWFVRMRFPGHQNYKFVKGVPDGWEESTLKNFCEKVTDGTHDTPKPSDSGHLLVTGKNIRDYQVDFEGAYFISENDHNEISKRSGLKEWDILYSNIGTVGQIAIVGASPDYSVKNVIIFRPINAHESLFLFHVLKNPAIAEHLIAFSSGASQQFIGLGTVREFKILKPLPAQIEMFGQITSKFFEQRNSLISSNQILSCLRDLLLPRLISGKLSVEGLDIQFPPSIQEEPTAPEATHA